MNFKKITVSNTSESKSLKNRRFYSKKEREHFIKLWQDSHLSQVDFCTEHNINIKNFYRWRTQLMPKATKAPIKQAEPEALTSEMTNCNLQCRLPNGVEIKLSDVSDNSVIISILKGIAQCKFN